MESGINQDIIYIKSNAITLEVKKKLEEITVDCDGQITPCPFNNNSCVSYYIIKCNTKIEERGFNINKYKNNFTAYIQIVFKKFKSNVSGTPDYIEIYNICTKKEHRGYGYMTSIFEDLIRLRDNEFKIPLWLGVALNNPLFNIVVNMYVRYGFYNPIIKYTNFDNTSNFPFYYLELKYDGVINIDKKQILDNCFKLSNELLKFNTNINNTYYININNDSLQVIQTLQAQQQTAETGGIFEITKIDKKNNTIEISAVSNSLKTGSEQSLTVNVPQSQIDFHTHSEICYTTYNCQLGWPSSNDMGLLINRLYIQTSNIKTWKNLFSIVFTRENIYYMYINKYAKGIFNNIFKLYDKPLNYFITTKYYTYSLEKYINEVLLVDFKHPILGILIIEYYIQIYFQRFHQYREVGKINLDINKIKTDYLKYINSFSVKNLLDIIRTTPITINTTLNMEKYRQELLNNFDTVYNTLQKKQLLEHPIFYMGIIDYKQTTPMVFNTDINLEITNPQDSHYPHIIQNRYISSTFFDERMVDVNKTIIS